MNSTGPPVRPPRIAAWSVELFASPHEADGILGDLAEDFQAVVATDGEAEARRRYWRQAIQTIRDLALAPWQWHTASGVGFRASSIAISLAIGIGGLAVGYALLTFGVPLLVGAAIGRKASIPNAHLRRTS